MSEEAQAPSSPMPSVVSAETLARFDLGAWPQYRKVALTRAIRMVGPFTVETSEGPLKCEDGYLAVDARGYPYPIAADEFDLIYEPAGASTEARLLELAGTERQPLDVHVVYRAGEWSAALQWTEREATFPEGAVKPTSAHANGTSLEQVLALVLDDADRIAAANG